MQDFWPSSGYPTLRRDARGWLLPTERYFRRFLHRPELALVDGSCEAERVLHLALRDAPLRDVAPSALAQLQDADARENYTHFLAFRDALLAAGSLEGWYLALVRGGNIRVPPLFIDWVVEAIAHGLLEENDDARVARAAELLFRPQRISVQGGQILAGDQGTLDLQADTGGLGEVGRLLLQGGAALASVELRVLGDGDDAAYRADRQRRWLLDLTHEVTQDLSHGLVLRMTRARSGLKALATVLERWVAHFLGVQVRISPLQQVEDAAWRWHVGLDAESSALLNDLYKGLSMADTRMKQLLSLFRLEFADSSAMRPDVAGKPVYLGLAMTSDQVLRLKPQNLLLNLPLAARS